ncbi:MAG: asparagine synthase (glutamine-hydrolyzing) [Actinobacteria bacterium]|nr:asparagine synthase (glutamine-hydrolyzing) [Actinomycetota bacterium]
MTTVSEVCGIAGFVAARSAAPPEASRLRSAIEALAHRGPNDSGLFESDAVALGSTRLSIIDLEGGAQPMTSEDGSVVVVYNGEIWNYRALRAELADCGHRLETNSDTEVLVHGYEEWGSDLVDHLDGMFAFAVWDSRRERLLLARDRLGKKPVYVRLTERGLAFGSDARSVFLVTGDRPEIAKENVAEYLFQRYLVSPSTLFAGVERLPPAHLAVYDRVELRTSRYWQIDAPEEPAELDPSDLRGLLQAATARRLMSDVPIGVLLSGGVDSTAVLALAHEAGAGPLATFTVGFDDAVYDERPRARLAASHFSTEHHELVVDMQDFLRTWPRLAWYRDDPIAEASEIPLLLLSEFAGRHVRVALSGDGGDEVFGGYPKYRADALLRRGGLAAELAIHGALKLLSMRRTHRRLGRAADTLSIREPLARWVSWFRTMEPAALNRLLAPEALDGPVVERLASRLAEMLGPYGGVDAGRRMLLGDFFTYLPDNMLLRSDKVLMGGSLEGRMPLLDIEVVRRATAAPSGSRASILRPKRVLRQATESIVPSELRGGQKRGFPVPIEQFLVEDGREVVERLLLSERCLSRGIFRPDALRRAVLGGPQDRLGAPSLFVVSSLELWARANVDSASAHPPAAEDGFEPVLRSGTSNQ